MIRNLFIAALLISGLYAAATVPLGERTLAEHIKAIGQTKEAKDLIEGTKSKLGPAASKLKDSVIGEVKENMGRMQKQILEQARAAQEAVQDVASGTSSPTPAAPAR